MTMHDLYTPRVVDCEEHDQQVLVRSAGSNGQLVERCVKCVRDEIASEGFCACNCGERLGSRLGSSKFLGQKHRQSAHRADLRALAAALGVNASLSVKTVRSASTTTPRRSDGENGARAATRRESKPRKPQLRISYRKAFAAVRVGLIREGYSTSTATDLTESILKPLLSDAQKAAL